MKRSDFEIMAPVGSYDSLTAAINAGANAVYFGVEGLNMRSRSSANFTLDDLRDIAATCSAHGLKSYLTVNTIVYDADMAKVDEVVRAAAEAGISAIIASDIAVIAACRRHGMEVHISTQCNISNIEAVRFYAAYADVIVLARELNIEQVRAISDAIRAENITGPRGELIRLEMFCHGALCMAVSGKCYLSLHQMNSSANRGACTQICRRGYEVTDLETGEQLAVENKYIMSPKDLKTIHFLDRLVDAGVTVFKIEGRARGPEYVDVAVRCYSEALQAICDGTFDADKGRDYDERDILVRRDVFRYAVDVGCRKPCRDNVHARVSRCAVHIADRTAFAQFFNYCVFSAAATHDEHVVAARHFAEIRVSRYCFEFIHKSP